MMTLVAALVFGLAFSPSAWLVRTRIAGWRQWLLASVIATAVSGSALIAGPWVLLSVYLRPVVLIALISAISMAAYRASRETTGAKPPPVSRRRVVMRWTVAIVFGLIFVNASSGRLPPDRTTDLAFPLKAGVFAVLQGGNSFMTNPFHHWFPSDRYGLDLVKLNRLGNRARGIAPASLSDYASYDVAVHSPCTGIVEEVVSSLPDNNPGETDARHISGNHILLRCGSLRVLLAHLRQGSVAVTVREQVLVGQLIGRIGNSGNTNEPHLHVGAVSADGDVAFVLSRGVPITFDGRFLSMNDVIH
jgi:hypothetical protein